MFGVNVQNDNITLKFIVADIKSLGMKAKPKRCYWQTFSKYLSATKEELDVVTSLKQFLVYHIKIIFLETRRKPKLYSEFYSKNALVIAIWIFRIMTEKRENSGLKLEFRKEQQAQD